MFQPVGKTRLFAMNIGFSTFALQGGRSGLSTYIAGLLRALQLEDHENTYRLLMANHESDLVPATNPNFSKLIKPSFINRPLVNILWHNTALAAVGKKYDLIHIPTARRIPLIRPTKIVATVHDLAAFAVEAKYGSARMFFNRKMVPAMIRRADHVIAISESTKNDLVRHVGYPEERISVIYSGINQDLFQPVPKQQAMDRLQMTYGMEKPFMTYVSRLEHPGKNHIRLIEAFERFKLENDSAHQLVLAGSDWTGAEAIRQRAAASPVKDDILFLGFVPGKSLPLLYSACDLMVFPSLFEGFGFPIIEALACGAPVICSQTSAMQEIAGKRLPTFDPSRSESIFRCMEQVLSEGWSPDRRAEGLEYAATFSWRETARKVMNVYETVHAPS